MAASLSTTTPTALAGLNLTGRCASTVRDRAALFARAMDCLAEHIAIVDTTGTIIAVNTAWARFALFNDGQRCADGVGLNYLAVCDNARGKHADEAAAVGDAIRDALAGRSDETTIEYPCHSPGERRWFNATVTRMQMDGETLAVVSHHNITQRKIAELKLQQANEKLHAIALDDSLTGIPNRRYFDQLIDKLWRMHRRDGHSLALLMIDIDCFKKFNDYYGHLRGDECLRRVASEIEQSAWRGGDFAARYGGEEFAVILSQSNTDTARQIGVRILEAIRGCAIDHERSDHEIVTASIGCAALVPDEHSSVEQLIKHADAALYEAKSAGRNTVACAG